MEIPEQHNLSYSECSNRMHPSALSRARKNYIAQKSNGAFARTVMKFARTTRAIISVYLDIRAALDLGFAF